jgi:hypothetical protein
VNELDEKAGISIEQLKKAENCAGSGVEALSALRPATEEYTILSTFDCKSVYHA